MKKILRILFVLFLLIVLIPTLLVRGCYWSKAKVRIEEGGTMIRVWHHDTQQVENMPLEQYLVGVVAAEMPASFELEALKAQAIAARTYALKRMQAAEGGANEVHPAADVCTDPAHCQAWIDDSRQRENWGVLRYYQYHTKIKRAVEQTRGLVLVYNGRLIDPVYHSTCGGRTENARDVWNYDVPYLRSVECPWDKDSPRWQDQLTLSLDDLENRLQVKLAVPTSKLSAKKNLVRITEQSPTGRAKTVQVGDKTFAATEFRSRLGLRSTRFTVEQQGNEIIFKTIGNGHGVGMCQYGANGLAKEGKDCLEILQYYYQGATVERLK